MREPSVPLWLLRWEPLLVTALCAIPFYWVAASGDGFGLSWDALNHHIYLGWMAEHHRLDQDYLAAGYQSFQYPYLYWPVYKLAMAGASGTTAALVLATLQLSAAPAVWMIARQCIEGSRWDALLMRAMAVVLAFMTGAILSILDMSSNDLLAAIPLVWAIALALQAMRDDLAPRASMLRVGASGLLAGAAVAFKFSNGPIAILLPILWLFSARTLRSRALNVLAGCALTLVGVGVAYGYWGAVLWQRYGNPMYPFYNDEFAALRAWLGLH
jgi:hypothetical protein